MYENIIFADDQEGEGDTQAVEEELIGDGQRGEARLPLIIVVAHIHIPFPQIRRH
jgi:hypothetical protein